MVQARRGRLPRHPRGLCDHRGRYRHCPYRPHLRCRRQARRRRFRHRRDHARGQGRQPAGAGGPPGPLLPPGGPRSGLCRHGRCFLRPLFRPLRQVRIQGIFRARDRGDHPGRGPLPHDEGRRPPVPHAEACAQLSAQLADGPSGALLPAGFLVHQGLGREGADGGPEQDHHLEARIHRHRPLWPVAGEHPGLEPVPEPFLGHSAPDLAHRGREGREVHRYGRGALCRTREGCRGRYHEVQSAEGQGLRPLRHELGELRPDRPAPSFRGRDVPRVRLRQEDGPRERPHRRLVRFRRHAVCAGRPPRPPRRQVRRHGGFHRRRRRPDPRLVLHAPRHPHDGKRYAGIQTRDFQRVGSG